ncbi:DinB family protein [Nocardia sp. CDC159]|uniref:DinB family protein n=1 Tax=Nocardia pulmonis TaxID=2951408 RepID=A0A9X2IYR8_9NOCA|nr:MULTISPECIES: DinB family protein [Nocardia]MCM6775959.1 DinB family protein [Nocardia pulmonis]MCM6788065.1 DinB family protein [Nocardia sp. CDC159]
MDVDWPTQLADQLDWHWHNQMRPRFEGLTDAEYFWEPVPDCWSVRPRAADDQPGVGPFTVDFAFPAPDPAPVTTISWRLAHIIVGVFGMRTATHFGGPPVSYDTYPYAGTAAAALDQLDQGYALWSAGVRGLRPEDLARPCGPAEGNYADRPLAMLILHINREAIHHGAEIALLRDLYLHRS